MIMMDKKESILVKLLEILDKESAVVGMEISWEKTTLITNISNGITADTRINGQNSTPYTISNILKQ